MPSGAYPCCRLLSSLRGGFWRALDYFLLAFLVTPAFWSITPRTLWAQSAAPPLLLFSEVHAMAQAVDEEFGEWFEICNPGSEAVNLQFWTITNSANAEIVVPFELWIPPGGYVVLARQADPAQNGGVQPFYVYAFLSLANDNDRLTLRNPEGQVVDSVAWGQESALLATNGASLERVAADANAPWVTAYAPWPGSAGDWGSPGTPYVVPPTATPTPSLTPTITPTLTPPPTPTLTPLPAVAPRLYLSEIMANPAAVPDEAGEWIELYNGDSVAVNLNGWILADQDTDSTTLSGDFWLPPGGYAVLARQTDPAQNGGVAAQMGYSGMQLANEADELLLLTPWGVQTDQLIWSKGAPAMREGASLERTGFEAGAPWAVAYAPWPGSAGDLGSPGAPFVTPPTATPTVMPTATMTPTTIATIIPTATPTASPLPSATLPAADTPTPVTPSPTAPPATAPRLYLSEFMANPAAVGDDLGEWIELYNGDSQPINLNGWILADEGSDQALLSGDFVLPPNSYAIVARIPDPAQNGGVSAALGYSGLRLANEEDELLLTTPWGVVVDRVRWGTDGLRTSSGASLERTGFDASASWVTAQSSWPGSAGDRGTPGAAYVAIPTPTAIPLGWSRRAEPSPLLLDQIYPSGSDQEYIVLRNRSGAPVALAGWRLGDAEFPGDREGVLSLPADAILAPGASWVVARNAVTFQTQWGRPPDAEWGNSNPGLPQLLPDSLLASGDLALADDGDEVLLLDPQGALADAVAWEDGVYSALGLTGHLDLPNGSALLQAPDASYFNVSDVRHRFILLPPNPFTTFTLPTRAGHPLTLLDGGLVAQWGSLGAASTFSPGGIAPPHILLAAAGALGLDFIAIADRDRAPMDVIASAQSSSPILLPAWRWQHPDGGEAIIYSSQSADLLGWDDLLRFLNEQNALAQLPPDLARASQRIPILSADAVSAPGGLKTLQEIWRNLAAPLLPAGNSTPPLPGGALLAPHYTGLAATGADPAALLAALAERRGWLTSSPGLWLTLRTADGVWMGSTVAAGNELALQIAYGDSSGASAGLALWQGDQLVQQLDLPPVDGHWNLTIPAAPGSMLYVVATQLDGDFAITAPIYVAPTQGGRVQINEVLPAPGADHNGDGQRNSADEYVELINMGSAPLALADYSLGDASSATGGHRFTFGADRFIGAGERLLLWHDDIGLSLNDDGDFLQLFDSSGVQIDLIAWEQRESGPSLSRLPDGGEWQERTPPTPGQANQGFPPSQPSEPSEPAQPPDDDDEHNGPDDDDDEDSEQRPIDPTDVGDPHSPNFGQATGPPASVALAKVRGLYATVEFRAQVIVPPGLFPSAIYVSEPARDANGAQLPTAGLGIQVYLNAGDFMPMEEGQWILVRGGVVKSFRGEMEIQIDEPGQAWPDQMGTPLTPLPVTISAISETLEGRLVSFTGMVTGWQGDSLYLCDPAQPAGPSIRVTVRSSLGWKRPYVQKGQIFQVVGIVSQFGTAAPWNDGYRVLVRYESDLVKVSSP